MRTIIRLLGASAAIALAAPAFAAPTITSVAVTGTVNSTVWDTTVNSFYTVFLQRPTGTVLNPNDNFSGSLLTGAVNDNYDYSISGDGFPTNTPKPPRGTPQIAPNSDPAYVLTVKLAEGLATGTLTGIYTPSTFIFIPTGSPVTFASGEYLLEDFSWTRTLSNTVGKFSSTNTAYNSTLNPGSGFDYNGAFTISAVVPEPATWGMMIMGFGAVGATLRTRRKVKLAYA